MNVERNCTYVNLGLMLLFLCNLGLIHSHFNTVLRLVVCSVLFSYINRSKAGDYGQSQLKNLSASKNRALISAKDQNSIETRGYLCTELGPPVVGRWETKHFIGMA